MREIKFRGIPTYGKDFVYGSLIININEAGRKEYLIKKHIGIIEIIPETLGQYTGLKDKNGVEAYHKDIGIDKFNKKVIIEWNQEYLCYGLLTVDDIVKDEWNFCLRDLKEIIGNIYENKELLNENK